jgi:hypothetical protein
MSDTYGDARHNPKVDPKHAAEEQRKAEEKRRVEGEKKADEGRALVHEREIKAAEDKFKLEEAEIAAKREADAERAKEAERLAALSPEERDAVVTPFAASVPHFTVLTEPHHSAEFILSEGNGAISRDAAYFADPTTIYVGMPVKFSAAATATQPATYVPAAVGADCNALCIYAGGTIPGEGLRTAIIARNAEVNKNLISWGAITAPEQVIGLQTLKAAGIIAR